MSDDGSTLVLISTANPRERSLNGRKMSGSFDGLTGMPRRFASFSTPTIVHQGFSLVRSPALMRRPIALWPGQKRSAIDCVTMTFVRFAPRSVAPNTRPSVNRKPIVSTYPGDTRCRYARGRLVASTRPMPSAE